MIIFFTITVKVFIVISGIYAGVIGGTNCLTNTTKILAYLDPGTGSMVFQLLIAGLLAGGFTIKMFWSRIKAFFSHLFTKNSQKNITVENDQKK